MTEPTGSGASPELGPLHPVTRLRRLLQQSCSFARLHGDELDGLISQLEAREQHDLAASLRTYRGIHEQEAFMVLDELANIQADLEADALGPPSPPDGSTPPVEPPSAEHDAAAESPKRARWLAQQTQRAREAISRRAFLSRRGA